MDVSGRHIPRPALGAHSHTLAANVTDAAEMRPVTSFILTLIAMWALADYSLARLWQPRGAAPQIELHPIEASKMLENLIRNS